MAQSAPQDFHIRFWGVRGTIACPGGDYIRYGGNTACVEVRCGGRLILLDAGTGLRPLGARLANEGPLDADLLLSHTHLDHLAGLPFFPPFFEAGNRVRVWAGHLWDQKDDLREAVERLMAAPLFPVPLDALAATITFNEFRSGDTLPLAEGVTVRTAPLNHPNGATGYRIEHGGRSVCYVTDTEHRPGTLDESILGLIEGADLFLYDATYTDAEYPRFAGWGHSTWEEGARLADAAGVGRYVIFHHAPEHTDAIMDEIADAARQRRPDAIVAREGLILRP